MTTVPLSVLYTDLGGSMLHHLTQFPEKIHVRSLVNGYSQSNGIYAFYPRENLSPGFWTIQVSRIEELLSCDILLFLQSHEC